MSDFFPNLRQFCEPLYKRLRKNSPPWSEEHTNIVKILKQMVKTLSCLEITHPNAFMTVQTDASDTGYGDILQQKKLPSDSVEQIVRYHSGICNEIQKNYSTIKKEILSIVLCIFKFQDDLFNKKFLLRIDCKSAKEILQKDVQNIVSKQIFARWQAILFALDFDIEFIQGKDNSLPDVLKREFLQGSHP